LQPTHGDRLRNLLNQKAKAASDAVLDSDGCISSSTVGALRRLAQLAEICDRAAPPRPPKRWPVALTLGVTLAMVSILLFARVSETEIELDLMLTEVCFTLPTQQGLILPTRLSSLGVTGIQHLELPRFRDQHARAMSGSDGEDFAIRLSVVTNPHPEGTITLAGLAPPAGSKVRVRHTNVTNEYRVSLNHVNLPLQAGLTGSVRIGLAGSQANVRYIASPASVRMQPRSDQVDLDLHFAGAPTRAFPPLLTVSELSLFRVDELTEGGRTLVRRVSTLLSGTLYFESLGGREFRLRPGEGLQFERCEGEIRALLLQEDHVTMRFHGQVQGMSIGSGIHRRSLMPTYLDWLRASHGLSLLWGSTLYLFGLAVAAMRWLRTVA